MIKRRSMLHYTILALVYLLPLHLNGQEKAEEQAQRYAEAGHKALADGHYAEARNSFEQLSKLTPGMAEVHATLAAIYFQQHEYELAVREVRIAKGIKPTLPKLDSLLGLSLAELSQFKEALPLLEKGFSKSGDDHVKRMCGLQLLRAYSGLSRDPDAVTTAVDLNKLYPDDPEVLYHTGRIYGNFAYVVMEKLHDRAAGSIWMIQAQGEANESQKLYDAAIVAFNRVLEIDPQRRGIHYRLGRNYLEKFRAEQKVDDRDAAKREFEAELKLDPSNGNAAYEIAYMQAELGNVEDARKGYETILKRFPDFEEALVGLGGILLENQAPELAVVPLEHATVVNPNDETAWYRLANANRAIGNKEGQRKALAAYQKLHSAKPLHVPYESKDVSPQQLGATATP